MLTIKAGSADPITWTLTDGAGLPINFGVGTWTASMIIKESPAVSAPVLLTFATGSTRAQLVDSKFVVTPDPAVTSLITWTRAHFDVFLTGPNANSEPILFDHGPVEIVF